jgi:hypothetical protein
MSVMRADLTVSARPIDRLRLRGSVAWDERDNETRQRAFTSIVHTDLFPVLDDRVNPVYGFERLRLAGSADYKIYDELSIGVGGEYRETDRKGSPQEVSSESQLDGWGVVQYRPFGYLGFVLKGGAKERDPDRYDAGVAAANGQNPLMRKYNMAYLYRSYGEMLLDVSLGTLPLTLGASAFYGDDSYNFSALGVGSGLDRRYGVDLTGPSTRRCRCSSTAGRRRSTCARGAAACSGTRTGSAPSRTTSAPTAPASARSSPTTSASTLRTATQGRLRHDARGRLGRFVPDRDQRTRQPARGLQLRAHRETRFDVHLVVRELRQQRLGAPGHRPATIPTILALGAEPWDYSVNYVGASVRYYFGSRKLALPE